MLHSALRQPGERERGKRKEKRWTEREKRERGGVTEPSWRSRQKENNLFFPLCSVCSLSAQSS